MEKQDNNQDGSSNSTKETPWKIYLSRALSAWGDRMWMYGSGLFMTILDDEGSLRVVSVYGFVSCLTIILLGPALGNWIDRSNRLSSAQEGDIWQLVAY